MLLDFLKTVYDDDIDIIINDIIKYIFQNNNIDINKQDKDGRTPLMLAIINEKNDNLIKAFINAGADVNKQDKDGNTALMLAIINEKNDDIIQYIIDAGADLNKQEKSGNTALMYAVGYLNFTNSSKLNPIYIEIISKKLIDSGADINKSDNSGWSPLMFVSRYIVRYSTISILNLLIKSGANLDLQDKDGWTALIMAARFSKNDSTEETVKILIDAGAKLNLQANDGWTALMFASKYLNTDSTENTIKMLIKVETDLNIILNANIPKCDKDKILKNIIGHISITQYRTFVDIFHYDISLLKPVKQKLLDFCRSLYLIETNDINNNWPVSIVTSNLNTVALLPHSRRPHECLFFEQTRCPRRTQGARRVFEEHLPYGANGGRMPLYWIILIHKYNHILEELFQNDPECVNFFSLMYME